MKSNDFSFDVSPEDANAFLDKLEDDDEFRAYLERSPGEALREVGIVIPDWAIPTTIELPTKQRVQEFRKHIPEGELDSVEMSMLGIIIILIMLGAMPFVVGDDAD
jgi:putative modified peptide